MTAAARATAAAIVASLAGACGAAEPENGTSTDAAAQPAQGGQLPDTILIQRRARRLEADVEAKLGEYVAVEGSDQAGDHDYDYTAYFEGDDLRLIRERQDSGDYGYSDNDYFFVDGNLTYYVQGGISRVLSGGGPPSSDAVVIRLYFDGEGRLLHAERTLNAVPVPLEGYEESNARRRADALREAALAGGGDRTVREIEPAAPVAVEFEAGRPATHGGRVVAREVRNYIVAAKKGQRLSVELDTRSRFAQFLVQYRGQNVYDSRRAGERAWSGELQRDGEYTVRVYLVRAEAQRGGSAEYELTLGLEAAARDAARQ